MKIKYAFETIELADESIAVPVGNDSSQIHGVLKLNNEGREILSLLKENTTEEAIVDILLGKYENKRSELIEYVHGFISELSDYGLIE